MTAKDIEIIKANVTAQLASAYVAPICLAGAPGIGKTSLLSNLATALNCEFVNTSAAGLTTEQLSGLPDFIPAPHMDAYSTVSATASSATQWSVPELLQVANTLAAKPDSTGCIILLDDIHRMSMAVMPYMYELLLERKLGQYKLHPNVAIIATMNDSDDAGFSGMDSPIRNRLAIHKVQFDFDTWYNSHGVNYHYYISSFLKTHPNFAQEDESTGIEGFGTPRSWHFLSTTLEHLPLEFIDQHIDSIAPQYVSKSASLELTKHVNYIRSIDFTSKVAAKEIIDIDQLDPLDAILYAYITHYIHTLDDVKYFIKLLEANLHSSSFLGFCIGNIFNVYKLAKAGKPVSDGIRAIISILINTPYPKESYTAFTQAEYDKISEIKFSNPNSSQKVLTIASEFIL